MLAREKEKAMHEQWHSPCLSFLRLKKRAKRCVDGRPLLGAMHGKSVMLLGLGMLHGREKPRAGSCRRGNRGATMGFTWELKTWAAGLFEGVQVDVVEPCVDAALKVAERVLELHEKDTSPLWGTHACMPS